MAINLNTIASLTTVSSLSELRLTNNDQLLEKRSSVSSLFSKIDNFFKGLTTEGRRSLNERNQQILERMQRALNAAQGTNIDRVQAQVAPLQKAMERLKVAMRPTAQKVFLDHVETLKAKPAFSSLSGDAQKALLNACETIFNKYSSSSWQSKMDALCERFLLPFDASAVAQGLANKLFTEFCKPNQWQEIGHPYDQSLMSMNKVEEALKSAVGKMQAESFDLEALQDLRSSLHAQADTALHEAVRKGLANSNDAEELARHLTTSSNDVRSRIGECVSRLVEGKEGLDADAVRQFVASIIDEAFTEDKLNKLAEDSFPLKNIHVSFIKDANRGQVTRIGNAPVPQGKAPTPEVYATALHRELGEGYAHLRPFISMMLSQAGMAGALTDIPGLAGRPFNGLAGSDELIQQPVQSPLSAFRQGNEFFILYRGREDYITVEFDRLIQVQTTATMRINLDEIAQVPLLSRDAYIPHFTIEDVTMEYVIPTAENAKPPV